MNTPLSFYSLYFHVLIAGLGVMTQYPSCKGLLVDWKFDELNKHC